MLWTVARFPDGTWSSGGQPTDPDYEGCEIYRVDAKDRYDAEKAAKKMRRQFGPSPRSNKLDEGKGA